MSRKFNDFNSLFGLWKPASNMTALANSWTTTFAYLHTNSSLEFSYN